MANTNKPFGFRPVRRLDGAPWTGGLVRLPIAYNYGTAIYRGDAVKLVAGLLNIAAITDPIVGVVTGFEMPAAALQYVAPKYWPAGGFSTAGNQNCYALVCVDPNVVFECQFGSATAPTVADINKYAKATAATAGSTATGISGQAMDASTLNASVSGLVWKFLDFSKRIGQDNTAAYSRGLFLPASHVWATRVAAA